MIPGRGCIHSGLTTLDIDFDRHEQGFLFGSLYTLHFLVNLSLDVVAGKLRVVHDCSMVCRDIAVDETGIL